jgi:hypothetical protein
MATARIATDSGSRVPKNRVGINSAVASTTMKQTKKTLGLKTETIRNLSTRELGRIAGGYTTAIYCAPTMTNPGNGCHPHPTLPE